MDSLIRKACELGEKTAHCRVEVILKATLWMKEKYRQVPNGKIAAMIALHYLMLAMRREYHAEPQTVERTHRPRARLVEGSEPRSSLEYNQRRARGIVKEGLAKKKQIAMIQIGQKIDDLIDDFRIRGLPKRRNHEG
jgi:hypothetical protein